MTGPQKVNVGIVGLGFGKEFIPIYQRFSPVGKVAICSRTRSTVDEVGERFGIERELRFTSFDDLIACEEIDAVHIVTPILEHARQTLASLEAGKHTACTVPMGTTIEELQAIVRATRDSGKVYMMMETALYTREFFYAKQLVDSGRLGRIQFARGSHMQNMGLEGWPEYWQGFPPMHYGTHAISPLLAVVDAMPRSVVCHGSGRIGSDLTKRYGSPFAVETATFKLQDSDVAVEATRALYDTVRQYRESFDIYGSEMAFEWEQLQDEGAVLFEGGETGRRIEVPDTDAELPEEIASFTRRERIDDPNHVSFVQGAGHGGSHPHLVREFIEAILDDRDSPVDAVTAAYYTGAGICAHSSAMQGGVPVEIPQFERS